MAYARAKDVLVEVQLSDGTVVESLGTGTQNGPTFNPGLGNEVQKYAGSDRVVVHGTNGAGEITIPNELLGAGYVTLLDAQKRKNRGDAAYVDLVISVTFAVDFGAGGVSRVAIPNATVSDGTITTPANDGGRVSANTVLTGEWSKLS